MDVAPVISIIVTTYKRATQLAACLDTVRAAAPSMPVELIVVDDSAEQEALPVAARFGAVYLTKTAQHRRGPAASRNLGVAKAAGRYIAFIDDDDSFCEGGLERLVKAADGRAFVYGDYRRLTGGIPQYVDISGVTLDSLLVANGIPIGAFLMERASIRYGFDEHLRSHEDWDFLLSNLTAAGMRHVRAPVVTVNSTETDTYSARDDARRHYWLDFLAIYARHPAPQVASGRAGAMAAFGIQMPEEILRIPPRFGGA